MRWSCVRYRIELVMARADTLMHRRQPNNSVYRNSSWTGKGSHTLTRVHTRYLTLSSL